MSNVIYGVHDKPATEDKLGLQKYIDGLSSFIQNCPTPMTIAIQGGWGSGKSSAIQMIRAEIQKENEKTEKLIQIDFQTWEYARLAGDNLFIPLLRKMTVSIKNIVREIAKKDKDTRKKFDKDFKERRKAAAVILGLMEKGLEGLADAGGPIVSLFTNEPKDSDYSKESGMVYDYVEKLKTQLNGYIKYLSEEMGISRIVFYIDDLDRLDPGVAVGFLEDLKNFLDIENCVFVLALDHEIVRRGIQRKYRFSSDTEINEYSSRFFDKLIQLPFNLPYHQYDVEKYVESLIADGEDGQEFPRIIRAFGDTNPRSIKRVFNIFRMYKHIDNQPYEGHDKELLVLLLLQMNHSDLYKELIEAISNDLSNVQENLLRIFHDSDSAYRNIDEWFDKDWDDKETEVIIRLIRRMFKLDDPSNRSYKQLLDIIGATAITGVSFNSKQQQLEENKKLIEDYLNYLGYDSHENDIYHCPSGQGITVQIRTPSQDHVNLNITSPDELIHESEEERKNFFENHFLETYRFDVWPGRPGRDVGSKMDIIYNKAGICVLRGISASEDSAMRFVGHILKNLSKNGSIFSQPDTEE